MWEIFLRDPSNARTTRGSHSRYIKRMRVMEQPLIACAFRPRRTNGATQTFRRPSGATTNTPTTVQQTEPLASLPPRYVPPHRNGTLPDTRYGKEQLLDLYKAQQSAEGGLSDGLQGLLMGGFHPDVANGTASGWARVEQSRDSQPGPEACWEKDGSVVPLGLTDMDDDEREVSWKWDMEYFQL